MRHRERQRKTTMTTRVRKLWWRETLVLMGSAVAFLVFFGLAIPLLTTWLDTSRLLGLPLGKVMAGGGIVVAFIVIVFWQAAAQERLDRRFGQGDAGGKGEGPAGNLEQGRGPRS